MDGLSDRLHSVGSLFDLDSKLALWKLYMYTEGMSLPYG